MSQTPTSISNITKYEFVNLGLMLLLLHLALTQATTNIALLSSLLLAHFGFFLLWQPAINSSERIQIKTLIPVLLVNIALYFLLGIWFVALWIILLIGLTSGSALVNGLQRSIYAFAAVILFLELSLVLTPVLFKLHVIDKELDTFIFYGLVAFCLMITAWPGKKNRSVKIDFMHSLLISFGLFSFYITSILISFTSGMNYLQSLFITALSIGAFLMLLSMIWFSNHGIASLGQIWEQHILNIGNPFENWVKQTSLLSRNKKITPDLYLSNSIKQLLTLPWVSGIYWHDKEHQELYGHKTKFTTSFKEDGISIELYSLIPMGSALKIHAQLLLHLMSYFYNSKLREITLRNQTHLKAVYETGSKLTHDIKNLLQSLHTLTAVLQTTDDPVESHEFIQKQLPLLTQRLQNTLDKLQTKTDTGRSFQALNEWWTELQSRYHGRDIQFESKGNAAILIDTDVCDTVLENLLENARNKRRTRPETIILTTLEVINDLPVITVCDDGHPVATSKMDKLFKQILPSKDGYGIGLYQSGQLSARNGYDLCLEHNDPGRVCFQLRKLASQ